MNRLALFAETPRAGDFGHRYLVAKGDETSESQISKYIKSVDKDVSVGPDFIGVARSVEQRTASAVRTGREVIVLVGHDVSRINNAKHEDLVKSLKEYLDSLEDLVLHKIDWSQIRTSGLKIHREELSRWLDEVQQHHLPTTEWDNGLNPPSRVEELPIRNRGRLMRWAVMMGALFVLFIAIVDIAVPFQSRQGGEGVNFSLQDTEGSEEKRTGRIGEMINSLFPGPSDPKPPEEPDPVENKLTIHDLATNWGITEAKEDDVVRSMLRAANWSRRKEANKLTLETGMKDQDVLLLLDEMNKKEDAIERLLVSRDIVADSDFRKYVETLTSVPVEESLRLRSWLHKAWNEWNKLHESVKALSESQRHDARNADDLTKIIISVAELSPDEGLLDPAIQHPITPLFDKQDALIWEFLIQCKAEMERNGANAFLNKPVDSPPPSQLAKFLADVGKNRDEILTALATSGLNANEPDGELLEPKGGDSVASVYIASNDFIKFLSSFKFNVP